MTKVRSQGPEDAAAEILAMETDPTTNYGGLKLTSSCWGWKNMFWREIAAAAEEALAPIVR